jgi:glycosyltransferase involved in cell wall biosynthesis
MLTPINGDGTIGLLGTETADVTLPPAVGQGLLPRRLPREVETNGWHQEAPPVLAVFCYEDGNTDVARFLARVLDPLARRPIDVHLFLRKAFDLEAPGISIDVLGDGGEGTLLERVQKFTERACNAFLKRFPGGSQAVTLFGCEWSAAPALSLLHGIKNHRTILSLHSLERQRSDVQSDIARGIEQIEVAALREARTILVHNPATAEVATHWVPESADRTVCVREVFPVHNFSTVSDPGQIKARYQVGPVDPTIVYLGDLSHRYGPDLLVKAMPAVLRKHPQARLVIVGAGDLYWTLRVYTRYLLLDHAIRFPGNIEGQPLQELVQAADIVAVPSRESTPWWPIQAAWAAGRPVVATAEAASGLIEHEQDSVVVFPEPASCAWGIDRVLSDSEVRSNIMRSGRSKLEQRLGWGGIADQLAGLMASRVRVPANCEPGRE